MDNGNIEVTFVDTGISMYYCEFDTNNVYILLENINVTFTTVNSFSVNISELKNENVNPGESVLRFNASGSGSVVFNVTGNISGNVQYSLYVNNVFFSYFYTPSFDFTISSWSNKDIDVQFVNHYPDPPYNGVSNYNVSNNVLNFSWVRGNYSDREVVVRKSDSYPSSPSDGTEVYNYTDIFYNFTTFTSSHYTVWSYNSTYNAYSVTGENIVWGAVGVTVYNESNFAQQITPFGLLVTDASGSTTYKNNSCNGTHYIDFVNDIPYGENTIFVVNATGYKDRTYYKDLYMNTFYNFTFYLVPFETGVDPGGGDPGGSGTNYSTTQHYIIQIIDELDEPVNAANIVVTRYNNYTDSFVEVSSLLSDGYGQADIWLNPGVLYKVNVSKAGFDTSNGNNWIPVYIEFDVDRYKTFRIEHTSTNFTNQTNYWDVVIFNGYIDGNTLYINFSDSDSTTLNTTIYVYEFNHSSNINVLLATFTNISNQNFNVQVNNVNSSSDFIIVLYHNSTIFGQQHHMFILKSNATISSKSEFDTRFDILGDNPFGWSNFIGFGFLICFMFMFGGRNIGVSLIVTGIIMLGLHAFIGFAIISVSIWIVIIILGGLTQWKIERRLNKA